MRHVRFLIAIALFLGASSFVHAAPDVEFVLDLSGSMNKKLDGVKQVDHARTAFAKAIGELPGDANVAVRVFAHRVAQADKSGSCKDTELLHPLAPLKAAEVTLKLAALEPKGYTPIAYSLQQAGEDFAEASKQREASKVIVLLSDGEETCGGDPISVLRDLREKGIDIMVHTIGFNVDDVTRKQLEGIATFSGGKYFDARNAGALTSALSSAAQEVAALPTPAPKPTREVPLDKKDELIPGQLIRGGDGYSTAQQLTALGVDLKLDHHQDNQKFDFFFLDLKRGDMIEAAVRTGTKGGVFSGGEFSESTGYPGGELHIHGPDQTRITSGGWLSSKNQQNYRGSNRLFVDADGRYYLLVGAGSFCLNKDHFSFNVKVSRRGDLDTENDAGSSISTALPIAVGSYQKTFGGQGDRQDWFKLTAKKGEKYQLTFVPDEGASPRIDFDVFDSLKIKIRSERRGGDPGQGMEGMFTVPADGDVFIKVQYESGDVGANYAVSLKIVE